MKTELTNRFGQITDPQHALSLLRDVRQGKDQNVTLYAEQLLSVARQLIAYFIDGLAHPYLQFHIMRDNPQTLQPAVHSAVQEQNLRKRFFLRSGREYGQYDRYRSLNTHEPMEVDHFRPTRKCQICNMTGHTAKYCRLNKST